MDKLGPRIRIIDLLMTIRMKGSRKKELKGEVSRLRGFMTYILLCCVVGEGGGLGKKKYIINKNNIYKEKETG